MLLLCRHAMATIKLSHRAGDNFFTNFLIVVTRSQLEAYMWKFKNCHEIPAFSVFNHFFLLAVFICG